MTQKAKRAERFPVWMSRALGEAIRAAAIRQAGETGVVVSRAEWMREAARERLEAEHPDLYDTLTDDGGEA